MSSDRVLDYIRKNELIGRDNRILVAFSGGNDSLGLLYMLDELKESLGITIGACHMNHMLRGEDALDDELFCKEVADRLDIPFYSARRDVFAYSKEKGVSVEVAGRELRYAFFKEIMIKEIAPNQTSLVYNAFDKIDYRDAFAISFEKETVKKSFVTDKSAKPQRES